MAGDRSLAALPCIHAAGGTPWWHGLHRCVALAAVPDCGHWCVRFLLYLRPCLFPLVLVLFGLAAFGQEPLVSRIARFGARHSDDALRPIRAADASWSLLFVALTTRDRARDCGDAARVSVAPNFIHYLVIGAAFVVSTPTAAGGSVTAHAGFIANLRLIAARDADAMTDSSAAGGPRAARRRLLRLSDTRRVASHRALRTLVRRLPSADFSSIRASGAAHSHCTSCSASRRCDDAVAGQVQVSAQ